MASAPELVVVPANSSVTVSGNFTLVMADANVVGTNQSEGQTRHWLVNGVTLKNGAWELLLLFFFFLGLFYAFNQLDPNYLGTSSLNVSTSGGVAITEYTGPGPADGSGAHR